jgi:diaminopimelate decarboxylase
VWPRAATRSGAGVLELGGVDVRDLAREFGTPAYVLDEDDFRGRCREWARRSEGRRLLRRQGVPLHGDRALGGGGGLSLDVCTGGELAVALHAGFPPSGCSSTATTRASRSSSAPSRRGRPVVVDSFDELARLAAVGRARRRPAAGATSG